MRFGMEIQDFCEERSASGFKVFAGAIWWRVKAFNAKGLADLTQGELKHLEETAKSLCQGTGLIKSENGEWKSPILKFLSDEEKNALRDRLQVEDGDVVFSPPVPGKVPAISFTGTLGIYTLLEKRGKNYERTQGLEISLGN